MSALPRGICPACGADVAVRRNGEPRQHDRWETFATGTGLDARRRATCPGTRQVPVALNQGEADAFAEDYATRAALGERLERGGLDVPRGER